MGIKRCKAAFVVMDKGRPRMFNPGALVDDADPIVSAHPGNFEDVETYVSDRTAAPVEQATAEPGEKRARRQPARGKAAVKTDTAKNDTTGDAT